MGELMALDNGFIAKHTHASPHQAAAFARRHCQDEATVLDFVRVWAEQSSHMIESTETVNRIWSKDKGY